MNNLEFLSIKRLFSSSVNLQQALELSKILEDRIIKLKTNHIVKSLLKVLPKIKLEEWKDPHEGTAFAGLVLGSKPIEPEKFKPLINKITKIYLYGNNGIIIDFDEPYSIHITFNGGNVSKIHTKDEYKNLDKNSDKNMYDYLWLFGDFLNGVYLIEGTKQEIRVPIERYLSETFFEHENEGWLQW